MRLGLSFLHRENEKKRHGSQLLVVFQLLLNMRFIGDSDAEMSADILLVDGAAHRRTNC